MLICQHGAQARRLLRYAWSLGLWLLCGILGGAALASAPILMGAEQIIVRADALGATSNFDGAIGLLQRAITRYPTYPRLYLALSSWQETRALFQMTSSKELAGRREELRAQLSRYPQVSLELFETFGQAMMNLPDPRAIRTRITELTAEDYPIVLGEYGPVALPGDPMPFTYALTDPALPAEARGPQQGLLTGRPLPVPARLTYDPKYGRSPQFAGDPRYGNWSFHYLLLAYDYDQDLHQWRLRFRVMWQHAPGHEADRARLAQHCAQVLLRLSGLTRAYTGLSPLFAHDDGVINVWLAEKGEAGGEAYNDNIYLHEVGVPRSPFEWTRELAHEYGHQVLPAVGGYTQPEWGANGRLGERLFLHWLAHNLPPTGDPSPWLSALATVDFRETRLFRPIRQFAALGPEAPALLATDASAMDACVGLCLYMALSRGPQTLVNALKAMTTPTYGGPQGFLQALQGVELYSQVGETPLVTLKTTELPDGIPYWVYLREGNWQCEVTRTASAIGTITAELDGKPVPVQPPGTLTLTKLTQGWHRLRFAGAGTLPAEIAGVKFIRQ
jgi:hypothetical protein